jgi:hypothetical protein
MRRRGLILEVSETRWLHGNAVTTGTKQPKRARRRRRFGRVYPRPGGPRGAWLVQYPAGGKTASGRTKYVTKTVGSEAEGKALLLEVEKALLFGHLAPAAAEPAPKTDLTLLDAIDEYIGAKRGEGRAEAGILRYETSRGIMARAPFAAIRVADLQARDIEAYMRWRRERKYHHRGGDEAIVVKGSTTSTSTINRDLALISAALGRLVRLGALDKNVAKAV